MKLKFLNRFARLCLAANDAESSTLLVNSADGGASFAILQQDGMFIPYGEYPHRQGLQKFEKADAVAMAANHSSLIGKLSRLATGGYPVYIGHPDIPGSKDVDKRAYGWVTGMLAENDGMRLQVKWSDPGEQLMANAHFKFYSPAWWLKKSGKFMRPVGLKSVGLTNDPNIPVPALANEAEEDGEGGEQEAAENAYEGSVPAGILTALGLAADATPELALGKITELQAAANEAGAREDLAPELATAKTTIATLTTAKATAEADLVAANEAKDAAQARLQVVANNAVQTAVTAGRVTPGEAAAKVTELLAANDLEAALTALHALPPKVKTTSATGDLGNAKTRLVVAANDETKAARDERRTLVANEYAGTNPALPESERKRIAWERAQRKHPEAFSKSPEPAA